MSASTKQAEKKSIVESLEGKKAPMFTAPMTGHQKFRLSDYADQFVILYFYPKDATPGCTTEGHDFTALQKKFQKLNADVFGISRDSIKSHEKFKEKQGYTIDLISDEDEKICTKYKVMKDKNMYGRMVRGIERSTFLIGPDGKVKKEWRKVKVPGHAQAVLDALKELQD